MAPLQVDIVTAEGRIYSGETDSVTAPGADGQLTILPSHAPLITSLNEGELKVVENGQEHFIALLGGFMEVNNNRVTILANAAEDEGEIDVERAEAAMRRAQERLTSHAGDVDIEAALGALRRARARLTVARHRRRGSGTQGAPPVR